MKTTYIPIALIVVTIFSCSPYERSHIVLREKSRAYAQHKRQDTLSYKTYTYLKPLDEVLTLIREYYVDSFDFNPNEDTSLDAVISKLDYHSNYFDYQETQEKYQRLGYIEPTDLGMFIHSEKDTPVITAIVPYSYAYAKGLLPGDRLVGLNGSSVIGADLDALNDSLQNAFNTSTTLTVYRPSENKSYALSTKTSMTQIRNSVFGRMLTPSIGYLHLASFSKDSYHEIRRRLQYLSEDGMKSLIFDLRGNGGGSLDQSLKIVSLFIGGYSRLFSLRSAAHPSENNDLYPAFGAQYAKLPIVLLVDDGSASASEIVAGVFQDNDRALIVGQPSYGKGVVQSQFTLSSGKGCLSLTTSRIYTPSGRCVHMDYEVSERLASEHSLDTFINNIDHSYEKVFAADTQNYFLTKEGRRVYGGVGVMPDYIVPFYSSRATRTVMASDTIGSLFTDMMREKYQQLYIQLPTPTLFYQNFSGTPAGKHILEVIKGITFERTDGDGEINYNEIVNDIGLFYSRKVNSYWAYTREALLDQRQIQFALSLLEPNHDSVKPVIKKVKKSKKVKSKTRS